MGTQPSGLFSLGFYPAKDDLGPSMVLKRVAWEVAAWVLATMGLFSRQAITVVQGSQGWCNECFTWPRLALCAVVSLALFPYLMRSLNRRMPKPGLMQVAVPFSYGFFVDLASTLALTVIPGVKD